jgi:hypothetical protein
MGADFIEKISKTIRHSWDRQRVALATSDLLTSQPECAGRSVVGEIIGEARLARGDKLVVERDEDGLIARRGLTDMVRITAPPHDVLRGIDESCGAGVGTVDQVHDQAGVAEISIC